MNIITSKRPVFLTRAMRRNKSIHAAKIALLALIISAAGASVIAAIYVAGWYVGKLLTAGGVL